MEFRDFVSAVASGEELQYMKKRYEEIDKAAEEMQTWGDVCL
jgi:hypothetical protein